MTSLDPLYEWHVFVARSADPHVTAAALERNVGLDARKLLEAIKVSLTLLAEAMEDGNEHLFPEMSPGEVRRLAGRVRGV